MADGSREKRLGLPRIVVDGAGVAGGVAGVAAAMGLAGITAGVVTAAALTAAGAYVWTRRGTHGGISLRQKKDAFAHALIEAKTGAISVGAKILLAQTSADVGRVNQSLIQWRVDVERVIDKSIGPLAAEEFRRQTKAPEYDFKKEAARLRAKWNRNLTDYEVQSLYEADLRLKAYELAIERQLQSIESLTEDKFR